MREAEERFWLMSGGFAQNRDDDDEEEEVDEPGVRDEGKAVAESLFRNTGISDCQGTDLETK